MGKKIVKAKPKTKLKAKGKRPQRVGEIHKRGMSARAWVFCHEYVRIGIKYKAAISAGYNPKTAPSMATSLLKNPKVIAKIEQLRKKFSKKMEISIEKVLGEYAKLAFTDLSDIVDLSGNTPIIKDLDMIDPKHLAALESIGVGLYGLKFKMHDKKGALDSLSKHLDIFKEDNKRELELKFGKISKKDAKVVKGVFDSITEE